MSEAFEADWVALTVRLVAHLRTTLGGELPPSLMWFEFTNEWDSSGYAPASLGRLVVAAAAAARAAWPGVRVGGPAWARPDLTAAVTGFLAVAGPHIDFVSYHAYCTGNAQRAAVNHPWVRGRSLCDAVDGAKRAAVRGCGGRH